jgi:hypothetical protein
MRSSQRSISKLVRVLQFGPQASASQQALTFDVSVIAEVCDEMFQVRSKSESDRRNRSSCLSGVIGSYPPTRKTCRRPIILTPMSYRSEITPKPSKFAAVTKPAMGDGWTPRMFSAPSSGLGARQDHPNAPQSRAVEGTLSFEQIGRSRKSEGLGLWQIRDIRSESSASTLSRERSVLPEPARLLLLPLDNPLQVFSRRPFRSRLSAQVFARNFHHVQKGFFRRGDDHRADKCR